MDSKIKKAEDFEDSSQLPNPHVEDFRFKSQKYGSIRAHKKAYQIPSLDGTDDILGWVAVLEPEFATRTLRDTYSRDLIGALRWDLVWSEYAICYDALLNATKSYPDLIHTILGDDRDDSSPPSIRVNATVLDLGAGTGNISLELARSGTRKILAVEKNRTAITIMKEKITRFSVADLLDESIREGVQVLPQDIRSLRGIPEDYFDVVLLNNVLYTIDEPQSLLAEAKNRLREGGEIRVTGPRRSTDLDSLFATFKSELEEQNTFEQLRSHFELAYDINNRYLTEVLYKYERQDVEKLLSNAGYSDVYFSADVYAGQGMLVCARV